MIRFFVSSTFSDLQTERDIINLKVIPSVSQIANQQGENLSVIDLRCGIDTEGFNKRSGMNKILSVCMSKIDEAFPHYIILLGDRYGTVPAEDIMDAFFMSEQSQGFTPEET